MDTLYLLIPVSALLILVIVAIFGWAVYSGQFENVEREGERFLEADETAAAEGSKPPSKPQA